MTCTCAHTETYGFPPRSLSTGSGHCVPDSASISLSVYSTAQVQRTATAGEKKTTRFGSDGFGAGGGDKKGDVFGSKNPGAQQLITKPNSFTFSSSQLSTKKNNLQTPPPTYTKRVIRSPSHDETQRGSFAALNCKPGHSFKLLSSY